MAQSTQVQGRNLPFSRVAIAHPVKGQPVRLEVQVPVNVSFGTNVKIQTGDADAGIAASFARCTPNGCFADFDIKDDALKKFRAATGAGKGSFADAGGHDVSVPLSFNGFNQAFDALLKEKGLRDSGLRKCRLHMTADVGCSKAVLASGRRLKLFQISRPPGETASMQLPDVIPRNNKDDGYRDGQQRHLCSHVVGQTVAIMLAGHCHRISPQAFSARADSRDRISKGPDYPLFRVPESAND